MFAREPVAIVGWGTRFPGGASDPLKYWELMNKPRHLSHSIPKDRFNAEGFLHRDPDHHGTTNVDRSYVLDENHKVFDAAFFNINPREAEAIDPMQRILMEVVYEALESAGIPLQETKGTDTAVFVGQMSNDWWDLLLRDLDQVPQYTATGTQRSIMSNRLSYIFDWHGPSVTVDTACSSSLVAVHHAIQCLRNGESRVAVAAGGNIILGPEPFVIESKLHMLSPTGTCKMWDSAADGYARGEGFAAVILKTLSSAIADGDHIQSIIRETGVNQDGKTSGITMPSAAAQAALIQLTYQRAGLNVGKASDRCQFFEAHGTGTPAGDPIEAEAISKAFGIEPSVDPTLFVGSAKTVIGHTEATAGLAGILRASLAMQQRTIPPNLLFNNLNPSVKPFYGGLEISTSSQPWPKLAPGERVRSSVNSFGFGGTNAHAILESYDPPITTGISKRRHVVTPFTLSAHSEKSLVALIEKYADFLEANPHIDFSDLVWTVQNRRTVLPIKISYSTLDKESLLQRLKADVEDYKNNATKGVGTHSLLVGRTARILGVFTGQGAQWATMGRDLLQSSDAFSNTIDKLDKYLACLPDRPPWTIRAELMAEPCQSKLSDLEVCQTLCLAIQIAVTDLLYLSGITFAAIVGHSSGELAACYAAGYLSAADTLRIGFHRGKYAKLGVLPGGATGGMMAVGLSADEAKIFCNQDQFGGRIQVATCNAPSSVTVSGELETIKMAAKELDEKKVFNRILKIDMAYHSQYMAPCLEPFTKALQAYDVTLQKLRGCVWISSVRGDQDPCEWPALLKDQYWVESLVSPVYFSQALEHLIRTEPAFDLALEVGPHAALKGPVTQTFKHVTGSATTIPYFSLLKRGENDAVAFSQGLGLVWEHLNISTFNKYRSACVEDDGQYKLLPFLPTYPWDHQREFWHESNKSARFRQRGPFHELLGFRCIDDTENELRWRNVFIQREMPWLGGHRVEGDVIFPAAGYCVMAVEASMALMKHQRVGLVELEDVHIERAMLIHDTSGMEITFSLRPVQSLGSSEIHAEWAVYSCAAGSAQTPMRMCYGQLTVFSKDHPNSSPLPTQLYDEQSLSEFSTEGFYAAMSDIGLKFQPPFRFQSGTRAYNKAHIDTLHSSNTHQRSSLMLTPALLDLAFHSSLVAFASPGDGRIRGPYLPTNIKCVRFDLTALSRTSTELGPNGDRIEMDVQVTDVVSANASCAASYFADMEAKQGDDNRLIFQIEGASFRCLAADSVSVDREMFTEEVWVQDLASGIAIPSDAVEREDDMAIFDLTNCLSSHYLREWRSEMSHKQNFNLPPHMQQLAAYAYNITKREISVSATTCIDELLAMTLKYPNSARVELVKTIGENLVNISKGAVDIEGILGKNKLLFRQRAELLGRPRIKEILSAIAHQASHRYPRLKILEVGTTGVVTDAILGALGNAFASYDITEFSDLDKCDFAEVSRGEVTRWDEYRGLQSKPIQYHQSNFMEYTQSESIEDGMYGLIFALNIANSSADVEDSLSSIRRVLKPGGYLVLVDNTSPDTVSVPFSACGLSSLPLQQPEWEQLLLKTGFSGLDSITHDALNPEKRTLSVMLSQAVDERVRAIRKPSLLKSELMKDLLIIGGLSPATRSLVASVKQKVSPLTEQLTVVQGWEELDIADINSCKTVLYLGDLDSSLLASLNQVQLEKMQQMFDLPKKILWVTSGRRGENPYGNMSVGLGRSISSESPQLQLQFLDIDAVDSKVTHSFIVNTFLRLSATITRPSADYDILWTMEPELVLEQGKLLIPRILSAPSLNNRLNCRDRVVKTNVILQDSVVQLVSSGSMYALVEGQSFPNDPNPGQVRVRVSHSLSIAIKVEKDVSGYLCVGNIIGSEEQVSVLTPFMQSIIEVPTLNVVKCCISKGHEATFLTAVAAALLAQVVADSSNTDDALLLAEPDQLLRHIVGQIAIKKSKELRALTAQPTGGEEELSFIHPFMSERARNRLLCIKSGIWLYWPGLGCADIQQVHCSPYLGQNGDLLCDYATGDLSKLSEREVYQNFVYASHLGEAALTEKLSSTPRSVVNVRDVGSYSCTRSTVHVIDWISSDDVDVLVQPQSPTGQFSKDKTYLLVGLTGDLGRSLARWMASYGARHIVISSRSPKSDVKWVHSMAELGATVKIVAMDVTNEKAVREVQKMILDTMPPIAGVVNGAMVLADGMFSELKIEDYYKSIDPKVMGSLNLDKVFNQDLDFFILFASVASIIGNRGQSNYSAANMFEASLAAQRRKRGLAASAIYLGMVLGVGYVTRAGAAGKVVQDSVGKMNGIPLCETDVHNIFLEAIVSGRTSGDHDSNLITGLSSITSTRSKIRPLWHGQPRFSHIDSHEDTDGAGTGPSTEISIKANISKAKTPEERQSVLFPQFVSALKSIMRLPDDTEISEVASLIDLGIDSLIAVEIRSWLFNKIDLDIPVLKIINSSSIGGLCSDVIAKI